MPITSYNNRAGEGGDFRFNSRGGEVWILVLVCVWIDVPWV